MGNLDEESFHKDFEGIDFGTSILWGGLELANKL